MKKEIKTIFNSNKEVNSNAQDFYRDFWSSDTNIKANHFADNTKILDYFFSKGISDKKILEIGVGGEGGIIISLKNNNMVYGADVSESAIRNCKNFGLDIIKINLDKEELPYNNDYFDIVFAFEVFEHFANPQFAIEEIRRVVKPDGNIIISIPTPYTYHWPRIFYPSLYDKNSFTEFLMINEFLPEKNSDFSLYKNCYKEKQIEQNYTLWSYYFKAKKLSKSDSEAYFSLGYYFWNKKNEINLRISPVEAVDLFRKSFTMDKNNYKAKLYLTRALLYRLLNDEQEEFAFMLNEINNDITNIFENGDIEKIKEYLYFYLSLDIESRFFNVDILKENKVRFEELLANLPDNEVYLNKLIELKNNYK